MWLSETQAGRGGAFGGVARLGLGALSAGWALGHHARRAAYALGLKRVRSLSVPVVSIGNLAVGGTGKTPFTAWLAADLVRRGLHPGILSRGYGAKAKGGSSTLSDEGAVLHLLLGDDVPQVEDPNRLRGGKRLIADHPATDVILLDDGFQHWPLARDLDVVLLDATRPFGFDHLLPRGLLREPAKALGRAGIVVVTRVERVGPEALDEIRARVSTHTDAPVVLVRVRPSGIVVSGETHPPGWVRGRRVFAACGIGNPEAFLRQLEDERAVLVGRRILADHAAPSAEEWTAIREKAWSAGAELVVTTRKDAVKLETVPGDVGVLEIATDVESGADALWAAIEGVLPERPGETVGTASDPAVERGPS